jgi:hypothetical protein
MRASFGKENTILEKRVECVWIFGGIDRETKQCFFEVVSDRIQKYAEPGTTIHSDCWKAYFSLEKEGYIHLTVNHSIEFRNKDTVACRDLI